MPNREGSTLYYAKIFLLMVIPIYGFFFTVLLAFSKDVEMELQYLARGALIARIVFLIILTMVSIVLITSVLPYLNNFIDGMGILRLFR